MQGWDNRKWRFSVCVIFGIKLLRNDIIAITTSLDVVLLNISNSRSRVLISKKCLYILLKLTKRNPNRIDRPISIVYID